MAVAKGKRAAMTRNQLLLTLVAAAAIAGCNTKGHTIVAGGPPDDETNTPANSAPVVLPPSITATKTYRCRDNSVIYVDWLSDGNARLRTKDTAIGTPVQVGKGGTPSISGSADSSAITYNGQSCKA